MLKIIIVSALVALVFGEELKIAPRLDGNFTGTKDANVKDYPYQLSFIRFMQNYCGAAIISEHYALTSGLCANGQTFGGFQVRASSSKSESEGQVIQVKRDFEHPKFEYYTLTSDIAVLYLTETIKLGDKAKAISLPKQDQAVPIGTKATATGWRRTDKFTETQLQVLEVEILDDKVCKKAYPDFYTETNICASAPGGCIGTAGSLLVVDGELIGVASYGAGCAEADQPTVYTKVATVRDYIKQITGL